MYLKRDLNIRYQKGKNSSIRVMEWQYGWFPPLLIYILTFLDVIVLLLIMCFVF